MPAAAIPREESLRLSALLECAVLDTKPEAAFDELVALAARLTDCPISLISLVDSTRQWFKARVGLNVPQTPRDHSICAYAIQQADPLIIPDATLDPRTLDNPLVTGAPGIRLYAGVPLRTADGQALGTLCVIDTRPRGLSDQQLADLVALARQAQAQLQLRRAIVRLEEAERRALAASAAKATFLANMSHEIRTPLTAVLGYLDLLLEPDTPADVRSEHALAVKRNAEHLLGLINDVLDFSKIDAGNMRIERTDCSPAMKVWDVMHMFAPAAREKGISLTAAFATPIPVRILSDRTRVRQVLVNLVSNAVKFTSSGSVSITASVVPMPSGPTLRFQVSDTGVGMTPDQIDRLFQPFSQADASTSRCYGGTGLGLAISKRLVELLNGELTVESAPGKGTTFTFTLPLEPQWCADTIVDWREAPRTKPSAMASNEVLSGRVLLAEDGPDNRRLLVHFLSKAGLDVEIVGDGEQAVHAALAAQPAFDLILMDMHMPRMDGFQATERLRSAGYTGPIAALTASVCAEDRDRCFAAGCNDFLSKPIDRRALIDTCRRLIAKAVLAEAA